MPVGHGGLTCLTLGLFHPYRKVRFAVADLLERIDSHPVRPPPSSDNNFQAGQHFVTALNRFQKLAFEQVLNERERANGVNGKRYETLNGDVILPPIEDMNFDFESVVGYEGD